jgi:hypothetical protein
MFGCASCAEFELDKKKNIQNRKYDGRSKKNVKLSVLSGTVCFDKVSRNYNDFEQRHNLAVCFDKCRKITVSSSKFSRNVSTRWWHQRRIE